jgi:uncharacterized RDD family membrane protein YckC
VAADAPGGLCASCLLEAGAETYFAGSSSTDFMPTMTSAGPAVMARRAPRLSEGDRWGAYQIGRLLGRGGMGEVYDAEHVPSGRRVALKVLSSPLQSVEERARFLREGQLAASVSHPHTVYIFGSEEIDGTPVISMELLPGGTLKDKVVANGPMRPDEAVAAVMELIGGLDAAASAGILHRDIKPSNCFVDRDGVVKVGDFGLSISTLARDVHHQLATSGFEGTPQFAPPEQLRGEPLDLRADIYAVGATLYYLLTGRPPFDAPDLRELFAKVTNDAPVPPRRLQRDIPARLSALVMQCLAKSPADRPASYRTLADGLRPFVARHDRHAPLGTRFLAGFVDSSIVVGIPVALVTMLFADPLTGSAEQAALLANLGWMATMVYYLLLEGATCTSLGKRLFGLRVVSGSGAPPTWRQAAVRAVLFRAPDMLVAAVLGSPVFFSTTTERSSSGFSINWKQTAPPLLTLLMFFATARLRNGWTGLHDVLSGTRVVARPSALERQARAVAQPAAAALPAGSARRYGPFMALDGGERSPGDVVRAFDPVLRRQVWIAIAESSAPPVDDVRRDLSRPARLHWLAGRRSADDSWDAYEAPDGAAWTTAIADGAWSQVKLPLLDLANELGDATEDGTRPPLALDRVWMRGNGRIVLLDFPPPDAPSRAPADLTPEQLLQAAVSRVPRHPSEPAALPLSARAFLARWSAVPLPTLADARAALQAMTAAPSHVQWWRRALPGALGSAPIGLMLVVSLAILPALQRFASSDARAMLNLLGALRSTTLAADNPLREPSVRAAAEMAIAGRYGHLIRDESFWNGSLVRGLAPDYRPLAEGILARHAGLTAEELAGAEAVLKEARARGPNPDRREPSLLEVGGVIISTMTAAAFAFVLVLCVLSALLVPGGLVLRQVGLAVVTRSGAEITRLRSLIRALVASLPAIAWLAYLAASPKVQGFVPAPSNPVTAVLVTVGVLAAGHAWTVLRRTRGPHDLLTGTWVVPR